MPSNFWLNCSQKYVCLFVWLNCRFIFSRMHVLIATMVGVLCFQKSCMNSVKRIIIHLWRISSKSVRRIYWRKKFWIRRLNLMRKNWSSEIEFLPIFLRDVLRVVRIFVCVCRPRFAYWVNQNPNSEWFCCLALRLIMARMEPDPVILVLVEAKYLYFLIFRNHWLYESLYYGDWRYQWSDTNSWRYFWADGRTFAHVRVGRSGASLEWNAGF